MKTKYLLIALLMVVLSACVAKIPVCPTAAPQKCPVQSTQSPYPTYTIPSTQTAWVVTVTSSPTPEFTPTITNTPEPPTSTPDPLRADKLPGLYLVNVDIAPGVWRNNGQGDDCYWSVTTETGGIIDNFLGMGGGTIYIPPNAFQVELTPQCGTWTFLK